MAQTCTLGDGHRNSKVRQRLDYAPLDGVNARISELCTAFRHRRARLDKIWGLGKGSLLGLISTLAKYFPSRLDRATRTVSTCMLVH